MNLGSKNVGETSSMQDYMAMNGVTGGVSIKFFCFAVSSFPLIVFLTKPAPWSGGWVCFGRKGVNCTAEVLDGKKSMS